ncbi:MAG TPA: HD domain-containing protein [Acidimicrobiia bacterium]|nr:HD domain-containing protein [Acidimicrobiia bacterium]
MPGSWGHLARRFFWSLRAARLTVDETAEVRAMLPDHLAAAFFDQPRADVRHGLDCARHVRHGGGSADLVLAALVHDIGKRHARLGVVGRSLASLLARLHLPAPGRLGIYLDHAVLGADELSRLGAPELVVHLTRHHHGPRPAGVDEEDWKLFAAADSTVV